MRSAVLSRHRSPKVCTQTPCAAVIYSSEHALSLSCFVLLRIVFAVASVCLHTHTHRCPLHTQYLLRFFPLLLLRAEQRRLLDVTPEQLTVSPLAKLLKTSQLDALNPAAQVDRHLAGRFCLRVCGRVKEIVCACVCECVFSLSLSLSLNPFLFLPI